MNGETYKVKMLNKVLAVSGMLMLASMLPAQTAGQDMKAAGSETKDATKNVAKGTGKAVKTGAVKTKHAVKRGTHATASGVSKGADKVKDKTQE